MLEQIDQMKSKLLMCIEGRRVKYVSIVFGIIILHIIFISSVLWVIVSGHRHIEFLTVISCLPD